MPEAPIRLAIRDKGEWIHAYIAKRGTMADAILVATIRKSLAEMPGGFEEFKSHCERLARILIEDSLGPGTLQGLVTEPAPENERSGHG
jgi:hypothetical protein